MHKLIQYSKSLTLAVVLTAGFVMFSVFAVLQTPLSKAQIPTTPAPTEDSSTGKNLVEYSGVQSTIEDYLCTPKGDGTGVFDCVNKLYRLGAAVGGMLLVFFIALAGYLYMTGGENGKTKGKELIFSTLTGLAVILGSYVLLNFINPSLVIFKPIQPPIFTAADLPSCQEVGFTENCILEGGGVRSGSGGYSGSGTAIANLKQFESMINSAAQANNIEFCALHALLELESSGVYNIVSNGPPNRVDPNHSDQKFFGLPFTRAAKGSSIKGHGIGLGQIFIYGPPPKDWADSSTPSRAGGEFGFNKPLTVKDLIDPETNIKAAAHHFAKVKLPGKPDYASAYGGPGPSYHGAGSINGVDVKAIYNTKYQACKKR